MGLHQVERGQGMLIEAGQEIEEDLSTMSSSMINGVQQNTITWGCDNIRDEEEGILEQNDEDEKGETQTDEENQEMDQDARESEESWSLATSEVDSWEYSEEV
jgi:hypothetical protein